MKTADFGKLFLAIFERTYDGLYICHFLWLQHVSIKINNRECNFTLSLLKRALKWVKCCMKAPVRQVFLKTSLFVVHFSKILENTLMDFFNENSAPNGRKCGFCEISFKCSINYLLEYGDKTNVIAARLLTNFTFVLQRIS